MMIHLLTAIG